ncbi:MAG: MBOAT family protein [Clostridia bacterium]|nr:MBOAT family protein [Clostridia bacterium]
MVFSSLHFLYIFLPVVMLAHRFAPRRLRNGVLLAASIWFYAWGEPVYVGLMLFSVAWNYLTGLQLGAAARPSRRRAVLAGAVAVNLAVLGFFKYYGFLVQTLNGALGLRLPDYQLPLPIGISFYTFQALSYVIDVYRGTTKPQGSLVDFATYITMFPQLVAGPIVKYTDIETQLHKRGATLAQVGQGLERVILGLSKKVLLANNLGLLADAMRASPKLSVLSAWLGAAAYALQIYFDFSGYSDMAIGMGRMLGFTFAENFDYPYRARSVTEFWRRWHISLSSWFRDYVYIPLGGNRVGVGRHMLNLLVVWLLTGLWHGASWNFVLWGLYYALLLILEKYLTGGALSKLPAGAARAITLLLVTVGWVIFSNTDFAAMGRYLGCLVGVGAQGFADRAFLYALRSNGLLLAFAALCCGPNLRQWQLRLTGKLPLLAVVLFAGLLIACTAYLVHGSYNPFLYFRF